MNAHYERWTAWDLATIRRVWPDANIPNADIETIFGRSIYAVRMKAQKLRLGRRPERTAIVRVTVPGKPSRNTIYRRRRDEIAALQAEIEAAPVAEAPEPAGLRETERLARARELHKRGINIASLVTGLRLTATEAAALRGDAR